MRVGGSTRLYAPSDAVWRAVRETELLRYVTWPLLGFRSSAGLPKLWKDAGDSVRTERPLLFGVVPLWEHEIRIVRFDDERREALTPERGGPMEVYHLIRVESLTQESCRYTDEFDARAGALTAAVWSFAQLFYRYRQTRWRGLVPLLE